MRPGRSACAPPCCEAMVTLRERDWTPLPHASLHAAQSLKADMTQSTGAGVGAPVGAVGLGLELEFV